jgi:pimeloyl-ACP methyl ester carboxylesterase
MIEICVFVLTASGAFVFPATGLQRRIFPVKTNSDHLAGPALLLLPGLMCDHSFWAALATELPPRMRCEVVDYGDADTLTGMAELALASAPLKFALAGHSMGGRVALEVMRMAPERVHKLVLMDTGYLPVAAGEKGETEKAGRRVLMDVANREGVRAMGQEWVKGMVHPSRLKDALLIETILDMFERKSAGRFARQQAALLARPDASPVLAALSVPTLLVCGRQDSWATVAQHEAMRALAPHAGLAVIDDAGHMVLMERPEATVQAIHQFLE